MKKNWVIRMDQAGNAGRINGTNGDDFFEGAFVPGEPPTGLPDVYDGRGGDDLIYGDGASDKLWGSAGNDTINGGAESDRVFGGSGDDTLSGGMHDDRITGGAGADVFSFLAAPDDWGGSGYDVITDFDPRERGESISLQVAQFFEIANFAELKDIMVQDGDNVNMSFGALAILVLEDVRIGQLRADDFHIFLF
jgi:Ca2+-binding RTX toxin-like protein